MRHIMSREVAAHLLRRPEDIVRCLIFQPLVDVLVEDETRRYQDLSGRLRGCDVEPVVAARAGAKYEADSKLSTLGGPPFDMCVHVK